MLEKILDTAKHCIGLNEKDGSFKKIIDTYNTISPLPRGYSMKYTDEWCATFISYLGKVNNCNNVLLPECSCREMINLYKNQGISFRRANPKIGDLIFYDWKGDGQPNHVGIISNINVNNLLTVIEGNRNEKVDYRQINTIDGRILGYITPNYEDKSQPSPWAKDAWEKATKLKIIDGTRPHDSLTREELTLILERVGLLDK